MFCKYWTSIKIKISMTCIYKGVYINLWCGGVLRGFSQVEEGEQIFG